MCTFATSDPTSRNCWKNTENCISLKSCSFQLMFEVSAHTSLICLLPWRQQSISQAGRCCLLTFLQSFLPTAINKVRRMASVSKKRAKIAAFSFDKHIHVNWGCSVHASHLPPLHSNTTSHCCLSTITHSDLVEEKQIKVPFILRRSLLAPDWQHKDGPLHG